MFLSSFQIYSGIFHDARRTYRTYILCDQPLSCNISNIEKIVEDCAKNYPTLTQDDIIYEIRKKEPGNEKDALEKYKNETEQLGGNIDA